MEATVKEVSKHKSTWSAMQILPEFLFNWLSQSSAVIAFLVLWEVAPRAGWVQQTFIVPPSVVGETIWQLLLSGVLATHIGVSLVRAFCGFVLAGIVAIPLGFLLSGWYELFERISIPLVRLLGQVNPFAIFPVFILLFGIDETSKVAMIFWVCLWPILLNTITGVKEVDPLLIKSARSMGVRGTSMFVKVILPAALPSIFVGLKMSSNVAFFMLIAAEMIGASSGLGWLVWNAQTNYQIPNLFAATVVIATLGLSLNYLFGKLEHKLLRWKESAPQY